MGVFDDKAKGYDNEFTHTWVGVQQRHRIHQWLHKILKDKNNLNILELNAGTGADVQFLSGFGNVLVTDVSDHMLDIARKKNEENNTRFQILDLMNPLELNEKFDFIFSNFGGLNCIPPHRLKLLSQELAHHLTPGGRLVVVFIHRWSLVEYMFFWFTLRFKKAFRRVSGKSVFGELDIYYYSSAQVKKMFSHFKCISTLPTGTLLSGEYMNKPGQKWNLKDKSYGILQPLLGADHMCYEFIIR